MKTQTPYKEVIYEEDGLTYIVSYNNLLKETRIRDKDGAETVSIDPLSEHERTKLDELYEKIEVYSALDPGTKEEQEDPAERYDQEMAEEYQFFKEHEHEIARRMWELENGRPYAEEQWPEREQDNSGIDEPER